MQLYQKKHININTKKSIAYNETLKMKAIEEKEAILESTQRGSEVEDSKISNRREQQNKKPMEKTLSMVLNQLKAYSYSTTR